MADTIPEAAMVTAPVLHEKKGETPSNATHALDKESRSSLAETKFELTPEERKREWVQIAALCYALFFVGWVDGTTGPLLPAFQRHWGVNDTVVSLLFIFNCVGVLCGVAFLIKFTTSIGFGKLLFFGTVVQIVALSIQAARPPFPVMVLAYFINGIGMALLDAQANGYTAALREKAALKMGMIHAVYGFGALVAPLAATQFAQLRNFNYYFLISIGLSLINTVIVVYVFKFKQQRDLIAQYQTSHSSDESESKGRTKELFSNRNVYLLAIFTLTYVGVEVTIGGWIVTYIIRERGGGASSGYVSSGYFGGLTAGRILLLWFNRLVGEYNVIFIYAGLTLGLEIVVWQTKSLIGNAVAVSFIGFFLGPMYPIMVSQGGRILPSRILTVAIGCIGAVGGSGAALFPFITGALANRFGIVAMQPLLIVLIAIMGLLWSLTPRRPRTPSIQEAA